MYSLQFRLKTTVSRTLLLGNLLLFKNEDLINNFIATSSTKGNQFHGSWIRKEGLLPPRDYMVSSLPLSRENVKGIEGNFYRISPFSVQTEGDKRSDFGIHKDANAPGSLGCIVLPTERGWAAFEREMESIVKEFPQISLSVQYS